MYSVVVTYVVTTILVTKNLSKYSNVNEHALQLRQSQTLKCFRTSNR